MGLKDEYLSKHHEITMMEFRDCRAGLALGWKVLYDQGIRHPRFFGVWSSFGEESASDQDIGSLGSLQAQFQQITNFVRPCSPYLV